jgi:DNA-binding MarR family transcriptional regulator
MSERDVTTEHLLRTIRRILKRSAKYSKLLARESGLTVPQLVCLRAVAALGPRERTLAHVAELAELSPPTASRIVDRLVQSGLLERTRDDWDRRKVLLTLTESGRAAVDSRLRVVHERFVRRFAALSEERRRELLSAFEQVLDMMDAADPDAEEAAPASLAQSSPLDPLS